MHLPDPNADVANKELGRSLENLLVSKNRRLLEELTKLRVSWEELSAQYAKSEDTAEGLQAEVARQRGLNEKLENDLMSLNKEGGEKGTSTPRAGLAGLDIGGKVVSPSITVQRLQLTTRMDELRQRQSMGTRQSYLSSRVNETGSDNETPSWKKSFESSLKRYQTFERKSNLSKRTT